MTPLVKHTIAITLVYLVIGCSSAPRWSTEVDAVLEAAGGNRVELENVLTHYDTLGDSLKMEAALYLIGNMAEHSYVTYYLHDTAGRSIPFDVLQYANYESLLIAADSLEDHYGLVDFSRNDPVYDMTVITADFLITQIDYAFRAWREKPWARALSWDSFRDYVLPYRGSNEPLEDWRPPLWEKYADLGSQMADSSDPIEAASLMNRDIMTWFGFDPRYYYHPTDQGLTEMMASGLGRCEDMTNVTIYSLRANGIGVTSDYTPYWANTGNNHAWNAIVLPSGEVIPFMGAEANPGEYQLANKLAKAYRKTFAEQPDNLALVQHKQEKIPRWLGGKYYRDVTTDYIETSDVTIVFERPVPDSVDIAYLCVFNSGEWKPIQWGRITDNETVFTSMGKEIAYLPALYLNEEIVPFGSPFILHDDGTQEQLTAAADNLSELTLLSTTKRRQVASTDGVANTDFDSGQQYILQYWDDGWQTVDTIMAANEPLVYKDVPGAGLYWLVGVDSDREERIFTYGDGIQVWW